jgi:hypothetical protein
MVTVPAGLQVLGNDTLTASYTPATGSAETYSRATGNAMVSVGVGAAVTPPTAGASLVLPTAIGHGRGVERHPDYGFGTVSLFSVVVPFRKV